MYFAAMVVKLLISLFIIVRWHAELLKSKEDITKLMTLECGKPLAESKNELMSG